MFGKLSIATALVAVLSMITAGMAQADNWRGSGYATNTVIIKKELPRGGVLFVHRRYGDRRYGDRRHFGRYIGSHRCVAVGKRRGGFGGRIPSTRSIRFGPRWRACRRALRSCREKLRYRKARGRNPFAACVVVSRRFHRHY